MMQKIKAEILQFFKDEENLDPPIYDPKHIGATIVIVIFSMGALFWLLWTLLVFEGGIFVKVVPALKVLFTDKKLEDFGWVGYPFELGIFEGFIANIIALIITFLLVIGFWWILNPNNSVGSVNRK